MTSKSMEGKKKMRNETRIFQDKEISH